QEEIRSEHNFTEIVGSSRALLDVLRQVEQIARIDSTVLISGETGTGKELIARAIHDRSPRKNRALVKVNCGAISAGLVEGELFYRLNVVPLRLPPLRERASDLPLLVTFFVQQCAKKLGKHITSVSEEAMRRLTNYAWPGNVRELQNVIERAVILSPGKTLVLAEELRPPAPSSGSSRREEAHSEIRNAESLLTPVAPGKNGGTLDDVERRHIEAILAQTN